MSQNLTFKIIEEEKAFTLYRGEDSLKTPRNLPVTVPTLQLAEAMLAECQGEGEKLDLHKMPFTQMVLTSIDISSHHREEVVKGIITYGESELICQRAKEPAGLVAKQNEIWQPYLDWCQQKFGAKLLTGSGIVPFEQSEEALSKLCAYVETYEAFALTGLSEACGILGSLVLGLALATDHANVDEVFAAAELDHLWQNKEWGEDPESRKLQEEIKKELTMCVRYLSLLKA